MVTNIVIKFGWTPMKLVGEIDAWFCIKKKIKKPQFLQFVADHQKVTA